MQYIKICDITLLSYSTEVHHHHGCVCVCVNSRGSRVDVFAHSWSEGFRLVLCFCLVDWSRGLCSLFLLFLCFLLSLGCNLNTHTHTVSHRRHGMKTQLIRYWLCTWTQMLTCASASSYGSTNTEVLSSFISDWQCERETESLRKHSSPVSMLLPLKKWKSQKGTEVMCQKLCCPRL